MKRKLKDFDAFVEAYKPRQNDSEGWYLFETYGKDYEKVMKTHKRKIWTLVDTDKDPLVVAGWHFVNRLGYFITQEPWDSEDQAFKY